MFFNDFFKCIHTYRILFIYMHFAVSSFNEYLILVSLYFISFIGLYFLIVHVLFHLLFHLKPILSLFVIFLYLKILFNEADWQHMIPAVCLLRPRSNKTFSHQSASFPLNDIQDAESPVSHLIIFLPLLRLSSSLPSQQCIPLAFCVYRLRSIVTITALKSESLQVTK
jgi:hypothetical protein